MVWRTGGRKGEDPSGDSLLVFYLSQLSSRNMSSVYWAPTMCQKRKFSWWSSLSSLWSVLCCSDAKSGKFLWLALMMQTKQCSLTLRMKAAVFLCHWGSSTPLFFRWGWIATPSLSAHHLPAQVTTTAWQQSPLSSFGILYGTVLFLISQWAVCLWVRNVSPVARKDTGHGHNK